MSICLLVEKCHESPGILRINLFAVDFRIKTNFNLCNSWIAIWFYLSHKIQFLTLFLLRAFHLFFVFFFALFFAFIHVFHSHSIRSVRSLLDNVHFNNYDSSTELNLLQFSTVLIRERDREREKIFYEILSFQHNII